MTGNGSKTMRLYDLRSPTGSWLGRVVITDDGYFSTVSEYGNYAYWWGSAGECFRSFLLKINAGYLLSKIAPEALDMYDAEATRKCVLEYILHLRRGRDWTADVARDEWELVWEHEGLSCAEWFAVWCTRTSIADAWDHRCTCIEPDADAFTKKVWPALVLAIQAELAAEAAR